MRTFLRHLRAAWLYATNVPVIHDVDEWTAADENWLRTTFNSVTGRKFMRRLENHSLNTALWATQQGTPNACGQAVGVQSTISAIKAHFPQEAANSLNPERSDAQTTFENLEQLMV